MIFDNTICSLGEGPLWHPLRQSLFWFDINQKQMFERSPEDKAVRCRQFKESVSAAGWVSKSELLIASERALIHYDLEKDLGKEIVPLEADNAVTRSNDGRADPFGGFWIGTMGKKAEAGAGAIYRFYNGEIRKLFGEISISNSICFSPAGDVAYFCDTPTRQIMKQQLDDTGWPVGAPKIFADVSPCNPDGSVVDAEGCLWNAQWGAHRVARYDRRGGYLSEVRFEASQITCPAFGGPQLDQLFTTSASENLTDPKPEDGKTFVSDVAVRGQKEHRVSLE